MRSAVLARVALVLVLVAMVGVPGLQAVAADASDAVTTVQAVPRGDAWTGVLAAPTRGTVTAAGDNAASSAATVQHNRTTTVNADLTPGSAVNTAPVLVSLTWGANPADLDIHLSGPTAGGQRHLHAATLAGGEPDHRRKR